MRPLAPEVLAVVERHFRGTSTRHGAAGPTVTRFWAEVAADCRREGGNAAVDPRLGRWLALQDQAELLRRREGEGKVGGGFPCDAGVPASRAPLDIVQIDHTKVDVTVVDPASRRPIGRPTLTLAIDVATRMATGFHLSLEPPCLTSVALCLTHAVMDKTVAGRSGNCRRMAGAGNPPRHSRRQRRRVPRFGVRTGLRRARGRSDLPAAGNAPVRRAYRAADRHDDGRSPPPSRLAFLQRARTRRPRSRGHRDHDAQRVGGLVRARDRRRLSRADHRSLCAPPNAVWTAGIAAAPPRAPTDPRRFLMDFLPAERRVLQRDGLHLLNIRYWSDELRRLMGRGEKVTIKYDPRDLSRAFVRVDDGYAEARPAVGLAPRSRSGSIAPRWPGCARPGVGRSTRSLFFPRFSPSARWSTRPRAATKATRRQVARRAHLAPPAKIDVTPAVREPAPIRRGRCLISRWRNGMSDEFDHLFPPSARSRRLAPKNAFADPRRSLGRLSARPQGSGQARGADRLPAARPHAQSLIVGRAAWARR